MSATKRARVHTFAKVQKNTRIWFFVYEHGFARSYACDIFVRTHTLEHARMSRSQITKEQARHLAQMQSWHDSRFSRVSEGDSFECVRAYGMTIDMDDYDEDARTFSQFRRDDDGRAQWNFIVLCIFLYLVEYAIKQTQINVRQEQARDAPPPPPAPRGRGRRRARERDPDDSEPEASDGEEQDDAPVQPTMAAQLAELGIDLPPEFVDVPADRAQEAPQYDLAHGRPMRRLVQTNKITILLEEVPRPRDLATGEGEFPELQALKQARRPAYYTLWVLVGSDIDLNRGLECMLARNAKIQNSGRDHSVVLNKEQRHSVDQGIERGLEAPGRREYQDADQAEGGDAPRVGQKRPAGQPYGRRNVPLELEDWEKFTVLNCDNVYGVCSSYCGPEHAMRYNARMNNSSATEISDRNPINANLWFSVRMAVSRRKVADQRQGLVYYTGMHEGGQANRRLLAGELPPYCSVTQNRQRMSGIWRPPFQCHKRLRKFVDLRTAYGSVFTNKCFPHVQNAGQILSDVWPSLFPIDPETGAISLWISSTSREVVREMGPSVDDPVINGRAISADRLHELYELALTHEERELETMLREAVESRRALEHHAQVLAEPHEGLVASRGASDSSMSGHVSINFDAMMSSMSGQPPLDASSGSDVNFGSVMSEFGRAPSVPSTSSSSVPEQVEFESIAEALDERSQTVQQLTSSIDPSPHTSEDLDLQLRKCSARIKLLQCVQSVRDRDLIMQAREHYMQQMRERRQWQDSYRRLERMELGDDATDPDEALREFDPAILTHSTSPYQILELLRTRKLVESRAALLTELRNANDDILTRIQQITHEACVPHKIRRALYLVYQESVLRQYETQVCSDAADVPTALKVMMRHVKRENLFDWRRRRKLFKIDHAMSAGENLFAMQKQLYERTHCIASAHITALGWWCALSASRYDFSLHMNLFLTGSAASSKTYPIMEVEKLMCHSKNQLDKDKIVVQTTRMTACATGVDNGATDNFTVRIINEAQEKTIIDKDDSGTGSADMKQLMDQCISQVLAPEFAQKGSNKSYTYMRVSEQVCVYLMNSNIPLWKVPGPMLTRMLCLQISEAKSQGGTVNDAQQRESNVQPQDTEDKRQSIRMHNTLHAAHFLADMLIYVRAIEDVGVWLVGFVVGYINRFLKDKGVRPLNPRMVQNIRTGARSFCIQRMLCEFFMPGGIAEHEDISCKSIARVMQGAFVQRCDLIPALGNLAPFCFIQGEDDVRRAISMYMTSMARRKHSRNVLFKRVFDVEDTHEPASSASCSMPDEVQPPTPTHNTDDDVSNGAFSDMPSGVGRAGFYASSYIHGAAPDTEMHGDRSGRHGRTYDQNQQRRMTEPQKNYDFNWYRIKLNIKYGKDPWTDIASTLMPQMKNDPAIRKSYSIEAVATILRKLSDESIEAPHYHKPDHMARPMAEPQAQGRERIHSNVAILEDGGLCISYHWASRMIGEGSTDMMREALKDMCSKRHQPHAKFLYGHDDRFPNTYDVLELGTLQCNDPTLPLLSCPNASHTPAAELDILYPKEDVRREHEWKTCQDMELRESMDEFAAAQHYKRCYGHHVRVTERDKAKALYLLERYTELSDVKSAWHDAALGMDQFDVFDNQDWADLPSHCFRVPHPSDPEVMVHHAHLLYPDVSHEIAEELYRINNNWALSDYADHRMRLAHLARSKTSKLYPEILRHRYNRQHMLLEARQSGKSLADLMGHGGHSDTTMTMVERSRVAQLSQKSRQRGSALRLQMNSIESTS